MLSKKAYVGLGRVPVGIGAMMKGWDITEEHYRDLSKFTIVNFRAMTEACPHDCFHCFTDKNKKKLSLEHPQKSRQSPFLRTLPFIIVRVG